MTMINTSTPTMLLTDILNYVPFRAGYRLYNIMAKNCSIFRIEIRLENIQEKEHVNEHEQQNQIKQNQIQGYTWV